MTTQTPADIDAYISGRAPEIQPFLTQLRQAILQAAPEAGEKISWGMATFTLHGNLVHFSAEKKHAGFHPGPSAIEAFAQELAPWRTSKGTVRFPYDAPLPLELIGRIVRYRVAEQLRLHEEKMSGKRTERVLRPRYDMPEDVKNALKERKLTGQYEERPPYQRNDYIGWIGCAKRAETRSKRLNQMLDELAAGNVYMGMAYTPKKAGK